MPEDTEGEQAEGEEDKSDTSSLEFDWSDKGDDDGDDDKEDEEEGDSDGGGE